jgi:pimeloyl-ACP methyl ester carboxylesterase
MRPETNFTQSGDVSVAYQVMGEGPLNLLIVPGFISYLEAAWENPAYARFLERLAPFSRLIQFDKRGTGLSDRVTGIPTFDERCDDVRAVPDAVGLKRTALFGISEGGPMSVVFAATHLYVGANAGSNPNSAAVNLLMAHQPFCRLGPVAKSRGYLKLRALLVVQQRVAMTPAEPWRASVHAAWSAARSVLGA